MKQNKPKLSIIIPVLNEEHSVAKLLEYLTAHCSSLNIKEILIVDGGSFDDTIAVASRYTLKIFISEKGRAKQMNFGAQHAKGEIFYFLHVDTFPPKNFDRNILEAVNNGYAAGCFQMKFNSKSTFLRFFAWFSKFNNRLCRGGDQSLFITKELFKKSKGFNEKYLVYEDNEFIGRLYKLARFKVLSNKVKTSARRYEERGKLSLQFHYGIIHLKNYMGASPEQLYEYYKKNILLKNKV